MEHSAIHALLKEQFATAVLEWHDEGVEPYVLLSVDTVAEVAKFLREDPRLSFDLLMCLSGIDWDGYDTNGKGKSIAILGYDEDGTPQTSDRVAEGDLAVAYHLYSYEFEHKFSLQVRVPRNAPRVPTVSHIWATAAWHEREAYDLVGIEFMGHPDLRRILLEDGWVGHPLRKDYQMPAQWEEVPLAGKPYSKNPYAQDTPAGPPAEGSPDEGQP